MGTQGDVIGSRVLALIVDTVIVFVVSVVVLFTLGALGAVGGGDLLGALLGLVGGLFLLVFQFAYFIYFEGSSGQTPGKRLVSIVVVTSDGQPIGYREAAIRTVLRIVDGLGIFVPYLVALALVLLTDDNQRLGDIVADTVVVKTN